jgi:hypothetical protein
MAWFLACMATAQGAQEFPYKAYVNREEVYVRSGPGDDYYPTDKLKIGQEVEIYRHDPGGWFAVRPPEGSFAWVSSHYLDLKKDHLATVNAERVAARVGSKFSDIRDVIQVRLQKGETVEILDKVTTSDPQGDKTTWCKIAPPSGEFRWIFGKYVDPEYPRDGVRRVPTRVQQVSASSPPSPPPVPPPPVEPRPIRTEPRSASAPQPIAPAPTAVSVPMRNLSPEEFQAALDEIDLKVATMVAEEVTVWTFDQIRPRAEMYLEQAQTAVERGRARLLVNKIARFEDIKRRYDAVNTLRDQTDRRQDELARLSRQRAEAAPAANSADRYDGVGKLTRVVSPAVGAPRYALVESNGQVRCYVSPAPGVSLQHYVGHDVGITGVRGYIPEQQAHHVMAKHVTILDDGNRLR